MDNNQKETVAENTEEALKKLETNALKHYEGSSSEFQARGDKVYQIVNANVSKEDVEKTARGYAIDAIEEWEDQRKDDRLNKKLQKYNENHPNEQKTLEEYKEYLENTRLHKIDQTLSKIPGLNLGYGIVKGIVKLPKTTIDTIRRTIRLGHYKGTIKEAIEKTGNLAAAELAIEEVNAADKFNKEEIISEITQEKLDNSTNEALIERAKLAHEFNEGEEIGVRINKSENQKTFAELRETSKEDAKNLSADDQIRKVFGEYTAKVAKDKKSSFNNDDRIEPERKKLLEKIEEINKQNPNASKINNYEEIAEQIDVDLRGALHDELDGRRNKQTKDAALEAIDKYLDKHLSILSADVETGLAAKETYARLKDKATLEYGAAAGIAVGLVVGGINYIKGGAINKGLGVGLAGTAVKATVAAGIGAVTAGVAEKNRQGRENVRDALNAEGKTVWNEDVEDKQTVFGFKDMIEWMDKNIDEKTGKIKAGEGDKFKDAAHLIAKYRTLMDLQKNNKGVQLIGFGARKDMEKNKLEFFKSLNGLKKAMIETEGLTATEEAIREQLEGNKDIKEIKQKVEDVRKNQGKKIAKEAKRAAAIAAGTSIAISSWLHGKDILEDIKDAKPVVALGNFFGAEDTVSPEDNIENLKSAKFVTQDDGTIDLVNKEGEPIMDNIEIDNETGLPTDDAIKDISQTLGLDADKFEIKGNTDLPSAHEITDKIKLSEYLNNPENDDVVNYSGISFDSSHGTAFGDPELHSDGYHIPISNAPSDSEFIVGLDDGKALSADIITADDGSTYALLPSDSAIFDTVDDGNFTGDWVSVGSESDGNFISYASIQCDQPFDGEFEFKPSAPNETVSSAALFYDGEEICSYDIPDTEYVGAVDFDGDDTPDNYELNGEDTTLKIVHGGYNSAEDPFWSSDGANFGKPIEAETPEGALSEWTTNIQKSPDQLVWNSMGLKGFEENNDVEQFFANNFDEDWRDKFHIKGEIDTEKEINTVANKIVETPEAYEGYKKLFLKQLYENSNGGTVEFQEIDEGGRYTNLRQANQFINKESDYTNSIIKHTKATTGGTGLVIHDASGDSIFDEKKMAKMLGVPDNQEVSDTMIRLDCGGQTTKVIESDTGPKPTHTPVPTTTSIPTTTPIPTTTSVPTTTPIPTTTSVPTTTQIPKTTLTPKNPDEEIKNAGPGVEKEYVETPASEKSQSPYEVNGDNVKDHTVSTPESQSRAEQAAADRAAAEQAAKEGDAIASQVENAKSQDEVNQIGADLYKQHREGKQ